VTAAHRAVAQSLRLRGVELRNRVVGAPMERNYCDLAGRPTQQYVDYLAARAAGGAALVFTESSYVAQMSKARPHQMGMHDDGVLPGLSRIADAVHAHGALLGVELNHAGRVVPSTVSQQRPVAPSAVACAEIGGELPRALSVPEIQEVVRQFGEAAQRAVGGGADVLSVHGAHGYLIAQFLSPRSNRRMDEYGRPTAFLNEVLAAVRQAVGDQVPVFLRLSAFEGLPDGLDAETSLALVDDMRLHDVDVIDLSAGTYGAGHWITPSGEVPEGYLAELAGRYRERTGKPVSIAGRVTSPDVAEELVASGAVDLITAARALHADADWAGHVVRGTRPRPCISCNQGCADVIFTGLPIWCAANPRTGQEGRRDLLPAAEGWTEPSAVAVVGAGPAGLEASVVLAQAGFRVRLHERREEIGGLFALSARLRAKPQFGRLLTWYREELLRLGVEVVTSSAPTPENLSGIGGLVVATGGVDYVPPVEGCERPSVAGIRAWFDRFGASPPPAVTIWGADRVAVYIADDLVSRGCRVTLIASQDALAPDGGAREKRPAVERLRESADVELHLGWAVTEILDGAVAATRGEERATIAARGPLLVSQGSVPHSLHIEGWRASLGSSVVVEAAGETDGATFDGALRAGGQAAHRLAASLLEARRLEAAR
jgi:2,4-dienoyl-CoA reductase-like NADH-dependent reductase (Old Yellow Enzyme family)/thioredoxin reductase